MLPDPKLKTDRLGGVDVPSADVLAKMHEGDYVLHARGGVLSKVPVEKARLPREQNTSPQAVYATLAPDGTVYASLGHIICKSEDGGHTWTPHDKSASASLFVVRENGSFIGLGIEGDELEGPTTINTSADEGRSWNKIAEIPNPPGHSGGASWIFRLPDQTLLAAIGHADHVFEESGEPFPSSSYRIVLKSGGGELFTYRSVDNGRTWSDPTPMHDWFSEGGVTLTPSGKLLAAQRYQRPTLDGDPPDLEQRMNSISPGWPYKNVCLAESPDQGCTWENVRLLTTWFGQTRGYPVAQSDGTVIVIHDTRYGPGPPGSRAMISRDEGSTWEDEVYYLDHTVFTGSYNGSVCLEGDLILTVTASSKTGKSWEAVKDTTDVYAIRWKPVNG